MSAYYNDNEHFCAQVLRTNIERGYLPEGIVDERSITELHASDFVGHNHVHLFAGIGGFPYGLALAGVPSHLRILTGGFPCQDISNAGKRAGITGERSGLWKEMYRLILEAAHSDMGFDYILIENVAALLHRGMDTVLSDLAQAGFDVEWTTLRASDVGAPHQRERIFIMAYPSSTRPSSEWDSISTWTNNSTSSSSATTMAHPGSQRSQKTGTGKQAVTSQQRSTTANVADTPSGRERLNYSTGEESGAQSLAKQSSAWLTQPRLVRVFDGLSSQLDQYRWPAGPGEEQHDWEPPRVVTGRQKDRTKRLKALGNAIVPQLVALIGKAIVEHEADRGVA